MFDDLFDVFGDVFDYALDCAASPQDHCTSCTNASRPLLDTPGLMCRCSESCVFLRVLRNSHWHSSGLPNDLAPRACAALSFLYHRRRASVFREFSRRATVAGNPLPSGFDTAWLQLFISPTRLCTLSRCVFGLRYMTGPCGKVCGRYKYNTNSSPSSIQEKS